MNIPECEGGQMNVSCSQSNVYRGMRPRPLPSSTRSLFLRSSTILLLLVLFDGTPLLGRLDVADAQDDAAAYARAELPVDETLVEEALGGGQATT